MSSLCNRQVLSNLPSTLITTLATESRESLVIKYVYRETKILIKYKFFDLLITWAGLAAFFSSTKYNEGCSKFN